MQTNIKKLEKISIKIRLEINKVRSKSRSKNKCLLRYKCTFRNA